jgi:hypothetical protein
MPSRPPLFDDDVDLPPEDADDDDLGVEVTRSADGRRPNYWIRRAVVVGGIVAVFLAAALVVEVLVGNSDEGSTTGGVSADWNRIVTIDQRSGRVSVDDSNGSERQRIDTSARNVAASDVVGSTALVVSNVGASVVDLDAGESTDVALEADAIVRPTGSALTMVATSDRRGLLVHGPTGDTIDTDTFPPIAGTRFEWAVARSDPSGRDILVTDSGNFQSVLFSFDRDAPSYFPGLALALDDNVVVTAQNVGPEATVNVFEHDGTEITSGRTTSVRAAIVNGDAVHLVTVDGQIITLSTGSGQTNPVGQLAVGTIESGMVTAGGDRLVVSGTEGSALIDADGNVLATYMSSQLLPAPWSTRGSSCVVLSDGAGADGNGRASIVELSGGAVLNDVDVTAPLFATADGCTLASTRPDGFQVASADSVATVATTATIIGVSPDGVDAVVTIGGRVVLADSTTGPTADSVDLGPIGRTVGFTKL